MATAWRLLWPNFGTLFVAMVVMELPGILSEGLGYVGLGLGVLALPALYLLRVFLLGGWAIVRLQVVDGDVRPNAIFSAGPWFWKLVTLSLVYGVLAAIAFAVIMAYFMGSAGGLPDGFESMSETDRTLFVLGAHWGFITAISVALLVVALRISFAWFLVVEWDLWGWDAVIESWRLTTGLFWELLGIEFMRFLALVAGALALVVGMIPAWAWGETLWAAYYRQIVSPRRGEFVGDGQVPGPKAPPAPA